MKHDDIHQKPVKTEYEIAFEEGYESGQQSMLETVNEKDAEIAKLKKEVKLLQKERDSLLFSFSICLSQNKHALHNAILFLKKERNSLKERGESIQRLMHS